MRGFPCGGVRFGGLLRPAFFLSSFFFLTAAGFVHCVFFFGVVYFFQGGLDFLLFVFSFVYSGFVFLQLFV